MGVSRICFRPTKEAEKWMINFTILELHNSVSIRTLKKAFQRHGYSERPATFNEKRTENDIEDFEHSHCFGIKMKEHSFNLDELKYFDTVYQQVV